MVRHLVTGGAGFIGSNIAEALLRRGDTVRVLDNFSTGNVHNLQMIQGSAEAGDRLEIIEGDLRSYHIVQEALQGVDYVFHQGALPSVPRSVRDPLTTHEVNVIGTLNLLQAARQADVRRLVFASSSSIYGNNPALPKVETMPQAPLSPYAISKLTGEFYCQNFWQLYGIETVCLRYFNVFGPRQDPKSQYSAVLPRFITAALQNQPLTIHGDGHQSRDFTYIENVVNGNLLACEAPNAPGEIINISCGHRYSLLDVVDTLKETVGHPITVEHQSVRSGDVKHSQASIDKAGELLGYEPLVDFQEGLRRTVKFYQNS
ncbi:MAG: SDR family oxidoreductase [Chloroflexota bacterium]